MHFVCHAYACKHIVAREQNSRLVVFFHVVGHHDVNELSFND